MIHASFQHRQRIFVLPFCLALVVLADYLFYGCPLGWTTALFSGIAAAAVAIRNPSLWRSMAGRIGLALAALIPLALVEEPSPLAILMALYTLSLLVLIARGGWTSSFTTWLTRWVHLLVSIPLRPLMDAVLAARWNSRHPPRRRSSLLAPRWIIPVLAGAVFLGLFAIANPIIQRWAGDVWNSLQNILQWLPDYLNPVRFTFWAITGLTTYGLLRYRNQFSRVSNANVPPVVHQRLSNSHQFIIRCLIVFNLVFAVQTTLDVIYLFGGVALPAGMTYTSYAHRGAYPLVATALLAGIFVLLAFRTGGSGQAHRSVVARRLVFLWIAQNIFLMFSTLFRTWLYVSVSLLTELRVAVFIWVFLIAVGFVLIIIKIRSHRSNGWLCTANAVSLFVVLYVCSFINFPGLIADFNVHHCREIAGAAEPLDIAYLEHLGPASLPVLQWVRPQLPKDKQPRALAAESHLRDVLRQSLADWRGWTLRRQRIVSTLNSTSPDTSIRSRP